MEMSLGLLLGLVVGGGAHRNRPLHYLAAATLVWTALVLSNSRGGIFAMLGQTIFIALLFTTVRRPRKSLAQTSGEISWLWRVTSSFAFRAVLVACLLVTAVVSVAWVGGDSLAGRLESMPREVSARSAAGERWGERRVEIWRATWEMIKANPVEGVGFGGYRAAFNKYHDA